MIGMPFYLAAVLHIIALGIVIGVYAENVDIRERFERSCLGFILLSLQRLSFDKPFCA